MFSATGRVPRKERGSIRAHFHGHETHHKHSLQRQKYVPAQDQPEVLVEADEEDEEEEDDDSADDERIMGSMLQTIVDHSVVTVARVRLGEDPDEIVDDSVLEERGDFRLAAPAEDGEGEEQLAVV
jgi:hypothetical protein